MGYPPRVTHLFNLPNSPSSFINNIPTAPHHSSASINENENENEQPLGIGSSSSSRWNPTSEQLMALEELYRRSTRTPSASQIQQIATRLRRFGKIEGKNVFYWFQNHKARERLKRRRRLLPHELDTTEQPPPPPPQQQQQQQQQEECDHTESLEKKETTGAFTKLSEEFISTNGEAAAETANSGPNVLWMQIQDQKELQQRKSSSQMRRSVVSRVLSTQNYLCCSSFNMKPHQENVITTLEDENREDQTLELFPLGRSNDISKKEDTQVPITAINTTFTPPNHYIEFLPLKN